MCEIGGSWVVLFMLVFYLVVLPYLFFLMEKKDIELREKANEYRAKCIALKSAEKLKKFDTK